LDIQSPQEVIELQVGAGVGVTVGGSVVQVVLKTEEEVEHALAVEHLETAPVEVVVTHIPHPPAVLATQSPQELILSQVGGAGVGVGVRVGGWVGQESAAVPTEQVFPLSHFVTVPVELVETQNLHEDAVFSIHFSQVRPSQLVVP
jgi:hypothetical protein